MKLKHWLRIAAIAALFGLVALLLGSGKGLAIVLTLVAIVAIPLAAMFAWSKRHRGN